MLASGLDVYRFVMVKNTQGTASACPPAPPPQSGDENGCNRELRMLFSHTQQMKAEI